MNRSGFGRVQQQAARTAMPGTTRQSAATAPVGARGAQFRAAEMQRGASTQRGAIKADKDADEDKDKDDEREPLFSRDNPDDETGQNGGDASEVDGDEADDEADDVKVIVVKS